MNSFITILKCSRKKGRYFNGYVIKTVIFTLLNWNDVRDLND